MPTVVDGTGSPGSASGAIVASGATVVDDGSARGIASMHPGGANVLMCDGTVQLMPSGTDPAHVKAMATIAGGEYDGGPRGE